MSRVDDLYPTARGDELMWIASQRLTPLRLAALGAALFREMCRAQLHELPRPFKRQALREMSQAMARLAYDLRQMDETPHSKEARLCEIEAAHICRRWQALCADMHPIFTPLTRLAPGVAEYGRDAYGFPLGEPAENWPKPRPFLALAPQPNNDNDHDPQAA